MTPDNVEWLATSAVEDDRDYRTSGGMTTYDDARVGRMLAREAVLARALLRYLPVVRAAEAWRDAEARNYSSKAEYQQASARAHRTLAAAIDAARKERV